MEEKEADRGPESLTDSKDGIAEGPDRVRTLTSTGEPGMAGVFSPLSDGNKRRISWIAASYK